MTLQSAEGWRCHHCHDTGHVCENHTYAPWGPLCCDGPAETVGVTLPESAVAPPMMNPLDGTYVPPKRLTIHVYFGDIEGCIHGACHCGGAGEPCTVCCSPIELFSEASIGTAFTPDWQRDVAQEAANVPR